MNINDLYQTTDSSLSGEILLTNTVPTIPITTETFSDAYWLGFMRDWLPWQKTSQCSYNPETTDLTFSDVTNYSDYPSVGMMCHVDGYDTSYNATFFYDDDNERWRCSYTSDANNILRLINKINPQSVSMRSVMLFFKWFSPINPSFWQVSVTLSIQNFLDFMNDDYTITIPFDNDYPVKYSDFQNGEKTDVHYVGDSIVVLTGFEFIPAAYNYADATVHRRFCRMFTTCNYNDVACITCGENLFTTSGITVAYSYTQNKLSYAWDRTVVDAGSTPSVITKPIAGNIVGTVNLGTELLNPNSDNFKFISDRTVAQRVSSDQLYFFRAYFFSDVYKTAGLYRWTDSDLYGYHDEHVYYPTFNQDNKNEFTLGLQTGSENVLSPVLPLWYQIDDIQANTYTDTDKPTPEPQDVGTDTSPTETGTNVPDFTSIRRVSGNAFNSLYKIPLVGVDEMGFLLSQSATTFWQALGTATDDKQSNILDYVVSLKWYPCDIADGTAQNVIQFGYNGNAQLAFSSGIIIHKINFCYQHFDMGSIFVPAYFDDICFLDYEPYTTCKLYIPYIGFVDVPSNLVINHTINFNYIVDLTTGIATCFVDNGHNIVYTGSGQIGVDISVSGNDIITQSQQTVSAYLNGATKLANGVMGLCIGGLSGNATAGIGSVGGIMSDMATTAIDIASAKRGKPVSVSGGSGFGASFNPQSPCVFVERNCVKIPSGYGHTVGFVSNTKSKIGDLSGFTKIENPDLSGIPSINQNEMVLLSNLLKTGFYA